MLYALTKQGALPLPAPEATLHDLFDGVPEGVYSGLRSYGARWLRLEDHMARTERSLALLGWEPAMDQELLRTALREVADGEHLRVRFDVLREDWRTAVGTCRMLLGVTPFAPVPDAILRDGARVITTADLHRDLPRAKTTRFVLERAPHVPREDYEVIMVDRQGRLLEGSSSNFHVVNNGVLVTAGQGVLEGITRMIVLELAARLNVPVELDAPRIDQLDQWDEAFVTSSTRALVPVVAIDGRAIGSGKPGPVAQRLRAAYLRYADQHARVA